MVGVNKFSLILIALILLFGGYGQVLELTGSDFETVTSQNKILVLFYLNNSLPCQQMATLCALTAASLTKCGSDIKVGRFNCENDPERTMCFKWGLKFVPAMKYYRNGAVIDYNGTRNAAGFLTFLSKYP